MPLFRKKPITVQAEQFWPEKQPWPEGVYLNDAVGAPFPGLPVIDTREGDHHIVSPGDWIITGVKGERYPCKPDVFADTYEEVELRFV